MNKDEYMSELQINADSIAFRYLTEMRDISLYTNLQEYCEFNVLASFGKLGWYKDIARFVCKNGAELKRKLKLPEFMELSKRYRIASLKKEVKTFKDISKLKVKPYGRH